MNKILQEREMTYSLDVKHQNWSNAKYTSVCDALHFV